MANYDYHSTLPEPKAVILHLDMNAFFASVEQACNPFLRDKPVAVVPSLKYKNAAIIARSYEAKAYGVKSFMHLGDARALCPELIAVPTDHLRYYEINQRIYKILNQYTPKIEIYSIDEFFLDLTDYFSLHPHRSWESLALELKQRIAAEIHPVLKCSIGVAPNKLLAKVGSDYQKPDGLTVIPWVKRHEFLDSMELIDIWGIGYHCVPKLEAMGIYSTKDLRATPIATLENAVGSYWTRLKQIANGEHYEGVNRDRQLKPQKTMQHAHTLSTPTDDMHEIRTLLRKQIERLCVRLRKHSQLAGEVSLGIRPAGEISYGWGRIPRLGAYATLRAPSDSGRDIYEQCLPLLDSLDLRGIKARLVVVGVSKLTLPSMQLLIDQRNPKLLKLEKALDKINRTYGEFTMRSADILRQRAKERELSIDRLAMTFHPD
jgi:DNA polymerase-4